MNTSDQQLVKDIRAAILREFGFACSGAELVAMGNEVMPEPEDTGNNAPGAACIVYTEGLIYTPAAWGIREWWERAQAQVNRTYPEAHFEMVSSAVVAWYAD